ncbi:tetratricopeptide repeat protein [Desulfovibrio sp. JC010]|uniref:tetratricopeptide repeat protein n=1 Tax=Desulfovibrio sp. JC010 TaxID=2593641 RepID=UPI0013D55890|nr:tetratricopeptide repeat protein [Desulfovibrio sp. JC010]NDV26016.1 tetratricopeptide repeat protein [Desulfovibrio sp. JC010]
MMHSVRNISLAGFLCACLILLCTPLAGAKNFPPQARHAMIKAQSDLKEGNMQGAERTLSEYIRTTKEKVPAEVFIMLGGSRHDSGNKKGALAAFLEGYTLCPGNQSLCRNSAVLLYEQKKYEQAARMFENTYELAKPKDPQMLYHAGAAYYEGEKYRQSARILARLLAETQNPQKDWIKLAVHSYLLSGQQKKALRCLKKLLKKHPETPEYWKMLAKVEMDRKKYVDAAAALEMGYSFSSPTKQENRQLAQLYRYINAPLKAADILNGLYGKNPTNKQIQELVSLYSCAGKPQQALKLVDQALKNNPQQKSSLQLLMTKGKLLYQQRKFNAARRAFSLYLKQNPKDSEARLYRGFCFWELKQWQLSRNDFQKLTHIKKYKARAKRALTALDDLQEARTEATEG